MEPSQARTLWHRLEALNAVAYFAPECREAPAALGLRGFWMGYFACRAAPLGAVGPGVVEATFANFHPDRVRRAIPDAWAIATPIEVLEARGASAAAALRRCLPSGEAEEVAEDVLPLLRRAIDGGDPLGRPLFAANRDVPPPADPVVALWQAVTTLREHRGDAHVALLAGAGLDGCEVHVLAASVDGTPAELYQQSRGWSGGDWTAATERLASRGLVVGDGTASAAGRRLRGELEAATDALAATTYRALGHPDLVRLIDRLGPAALEVAAAGELRFPNPMGLPDPAQGRG